MVKTEDVRGSSYSSAFNSFVALHHHPEGSRPRCEPWNTTQPDRRKLHPDDAQDTTHCAKEPLSPATRPSRYGSSSVTLTARWEPTQPWFPQVEEIRRRTRSAQLPAEDSISQLPPRLLSRHPATRSTSYSADHSHATKTNSTGTLLSRECRDERAGCGVRRCRRH